MRKNLPGDCVQSIKDTLRAAGLPLNPTVQFSFCPNFTREMVKEARIFVSPSAPKTTRSSRSSIEENPVFSVALVRAIPMRECDYIAGNVDLDSHSLDAMFDLQSKLIQALYLVPGVMSLECVPDVQKAYTSDGIWYSVIRVTFGTDASKLGKDAVLYYSLNSGSTLAEMTSILSGVSDSKVSLQTGERIVTKRANIGWEQTEASLKKCQIEFSLTLDTSDAGYLAVQSAWLNGTTLALAALSGPADVAGNVGIVGDFAITGFDRAEPVEGSVKVSVIAKLNVFTAWVTTTETVPDTTVPTCVLDPVNGSVDVPVDSALTSTFSEAVLPSDIKAGNILLIHGATGAVVPGTLAYSRVTKAATFTPAADLDGTAPYIFVVANVHDLAGNVMLPVSSVFTTDMEPN